MKDHVLHVLSIIKQPLISHCCKEIMKVLAGLADTRQITTSLYLSFSICGYGHICHKPEL